MNKQHILDEIRRTAKENGEQPLGAQRFFKATGIKQSDWFGKYWETFGDAQEEAGFKRNQMQAAHDETLLLDSFINLMRERKRFPTNAILRMKARSDTAFPSHNTFARLGATKQQRIDTIRSYCKGRAGFEDIMAICDALAPTAESTESRNDSESQESFGFVYLMRSGRYYKIGRTNHVGGRERDLGILLPEKLITVHSIRTDDPVRIEAYWHARFAAQRQHNSEWFDLSVADVKAFKRRKFM
jgi:hypothetical protein